MKHLFLMVMIFYFSLNAFSQDYSIHDLKTGKWKTDTTHIYQLPWQPGRKYLLIQGYQSSFSHKGENALDFKMKKGTPICAARNGVVVALKEDSDVGGLKDEYLSQGNYVMILHSDGTEAHYWHLQKNGVTVNEGDSVKAGEIIGYSGNTGYSAFPHLHFEVVNKQGIQLTTRFATNKGVIYLRPGRKYKKS